MDQFVVKTPNASSKASKHQYPPGTFHVEDGMLFCSSYNMVIDHVWKIVVDKHLEALKTVLNVKQCRNIV